MSGFDVSGFDVSGFGGGGFGGSGFNAGSDGASGVSAGGIDVAILHTDGGSRNNPGESGIGFTLCVDTGRELETICRGGAYIGVATNSVAEYRAMIWGLQNARALGVRKLEVRADSEFLIKQILGEYRVKSEGIKPLFGEVMQLLGRFESYNAEHVMRGLNSAADELANQAMDARGNVGNFAVPYESNELFGFGGLEADDSAGADASIDVSEGADAAASASASAAVADSAGVADSEAVVESAMAVESFGVVDSIEVVDSAAVADSNASADNTSDEHATADESDATAEAPIADSTPDASEDIITNNNAGASEKEESTMMEHEQTERSGTYTLWIKGHFDAAHALVGYPGECRNLHGHTWDVEVSVVGTKLDDVGIVYDFKDLKSNLMSILDKYDHKYLNEIAPFDTLNATAENLARVVYEQMEALLPEHVSLVEIAVWESPIAKLTYRK